MRPYSKPDQRLLAIWAADCSERVLKIFEKEYPSDKRPRNSIKELRRWIKTGIFSMKVIRKASLDSHAAARKALKANHLAACYAARATGQAVATAHVPQHSFGSAYYALKAIATTKNAEAKVKKEFAWELKHLSKSLRKEVLKRVIVQKINDKISVRIQKGKDF